MNSFLNVYLNARRRRADSRNLQNMDDWMLADIGLTRSDIAAITRGQTPHALKSRL